jgi:hypothetical protein
VQELPLASSGDRHLPCHPPAWILSCSLASVFNSLFDTRSELSFRRLREPCLLSVAPEDLGDLQYFFQDSGHLVAAHVDAWLPSLSVSRVRMQQYTCFFILGRISDRGDLSCLDEITHSAWRHVSTGLDLLLSTPNLSASSRTRLYG